MQCALALALVVVFVLAPISVTVNDISSKKLVRLRARQCGSITGRDLRGLRHANIELDLRRK